MITIAKHFSKLTSHFLMSKQVTSLYNPLKYCFACTSSQIQQKPSLYLFWPTPSMRAQSPSLSKKKDNGWIKMRLSPTYRLTKWQSRSRAPLQVLLPSSTQRLEITLELENHCLMSIQTPLNLQAHLLPKNQQPRLRLPSQKKNKNLLKPKKKLPNKLPSRLPKQINPNNRLNKLQPRLPQLSPVEKERKLVSQCQDWGRE